MFIATHASRSAFRQEGHVYRNRKRKQPPSALLISKEIEKIFRLVRNIELLQERQIFISEAGLCMVLLLVANVPNDRIKLRVRVGERPEALLPIEPAADPFLSFDEIGRVGFDVS